MLKIVAKFVKTTRLRVSTGRARPPPKRDELIGVSALPQQIKPAQTTFWMDVEICQELSSWQIIELSDCHVNFQHYE